MSRFKVSSNRYHGWVKIAVRPAFLAEVKAGDQHAFTVHGLTSFGVEAGKICLQECRKRLDADGAKSVSDLYLSKIMAECLKASSKELGRQAYR